MPETSVGFIDAGFLKAAGAAILGRRVSEINPDAAGVIRYLREEKTVGQILAGQAFLRAYWYDGAFDPAHSNYGDQRIFCNGIARTPGIQLRLGHIAEHPNQFEDPIKRALENTATDLGLEPSQLVAAFNRRWTFRPVRQQKGVDTLIALDMVRLASRSVYATGVLIAGDRDLAEAIRTAQDYGTRIVIATPNRQSVAREVVQLADDVIDIDVDDLKSMLPARASRRATSSDAR